MKPKNFCVSMIVFLLEGCVELSMTASICVLKLNSDRFANFGEIFSTLLMFVMIFALIVAPIYIVISGYRMHKAKLAHDRQTVKKYLPLFKNIKTKSFLAVQYSSLFFLRRYCMVLMIIYFRE